MIHALIATSATACLIPALLALHPHIETYATRKRLHKAHRASMIKKETK